MPRINLSYTQRPRKGEAVRRSALISCRSDDEDITDFAQSLFERENALRVVAVVVGDQNTWLF
jgi:hypothetical protein